MFGACFLPSIRGVPNSEAIAWYVEESQRLLEEQQRRAESLRTRGGQIAGFGALLLAVIGGNASRILNESHGAGRTGIAVMLIAATLCLAASIAVSVIGVNRPRSYATHRRSRDEWTRMERFWDRLTPASRRIEPAPKR